MIFHGVSGSKGIAIGKAFVYSKPLPDQDRQTASLVQPDHELKKLVKAIELSKEQLRQIRDKAASETGEENARIFDAHIAILEDPVLLKEMKMLIENEGKSAPFSVEKTISYYTSLFSAMEEEYARERATDIKDIGDRLLRNIYGIHSGWPESFEEEAVIVAHELTPTDTVGLGGRFVRGFAVDTGGKTSHAAILAQSMNIPAVFGLNNITEKVKNGEDVIIDGFSGVVITSPEAGQLAEYKRLREQWLLRQAQMKLLAGRPAKTIDGRQVGLAANITRPDDVAAVFENGGDGVGLYRTEYLYMEKEELPSEEAQYMAYSTVAQELKGRPVIIRTLDIGGDKEVKCLNLPKEQNPFLGWRGIRICLDRPDIFKTQLRAILRSSAFGTVALMYPMISELDELKAANRILEEAKAELRSERIPFDEKIKVGIMVEIPSVAITADLFAPEVDFFSIGTNDLGQYTLAVDRSNPQVGGGYQPLHPAVLRLIKNVIDASHKCGRKTGMCGELAGDSAAAPILLGLGLDEFSMSASSLTEIKRIINNMSYAKAKEIADLAMTMKTAEEISEYSLKMLKELGLSDCEL